MSTINFMKSQLTILLLGALLTFSTNTWAKNPKTPETSTKTEPISAPSTSSTSDGNARTIDKLPKSFFDFTATALSGEKINFSTYRGKVVLVVNTASQCGFTPQLKELEDLYQNYKTKGFIVLAFPSNDFKQEKGTAEEVQSFAKSEYGCTFPFFEKASVRGENMQPIYQFLTAQKPGLILKDVAWNFEKFLVNRQGQVIERWSSITKPSSKSVRTAIEKALNEPL